MRSPSMMLQIRRLRDAQVLPRAFQAGPRELIGSKLAQPPPMRQLDRADHALRQTADNAGNVDRALTGVQPLLAHCPPRLLDGRWQVRPVVADMNEIRPRRRNAIELFDGEPAAMEV